MCPGTGSGVPAGAIFCTVSTEMPYAVPAATMVAAASGNTASRNTTRYSADVGVPVTRSSVNGRLRSTRLPPTVTARLQPATTSVRTTATSKSRCTVCATPWRTWIASPNVRGAEPDADCEVCVTRNVRTRSSVAAFRTLISTARRYSLPTSADTAGFDALAIRRLLKYGLSLMIRLLVLTWTAWRPGAHRPSTPSSRSPAQLIAESYRGKTGWD